MSLRFKRHNPLWTHLAGLACLLGIVGALVSAHAPARVPVHFGFSGMPDRWGSIIELWIALPGAALLILLGSIVLDEAYARHEEPKQFNWLSLFDEAILGFLLGLTWNLVPQLSSPHPEFRACLGLGLGLGAALVAAVLERLRPHRPGERLKPSSQPIHLSAEEMDAFRGNRRWLYWEMQDPLYVRIIVPMMAAAMLAGAVATFLQAPWLLPVFTAGILGTLLLYGGMGVSVTADDVAVRLGVFGVPLKRIPLGDIASVEVVSFSPLGDFGGWGIRYSLTKRMWGYFLCGTHGAKIETRGGKRYLIGSNDPEHLAAVVEAACRSKT